nr:hypothetical protein [uncultured Rhodopila sp.]
MNRTIVTVKNVACADSARAAALVAISLSLIGSTCLSGGSVLFATLAAVQIALLIGAAAGRLAGNLRLAFAR